MSDSEEIRALTLEIKRLRHAIERNQQALMNARDASRYVGISHPIFHRLVAKGVIPKTILSEDLQARYARVVLDRIINERTQEDSQ